MSALVADRYHPVEIGAISRSNLERGESELVGDVEVFPRILRAVAKHILALPTKGAAMEEVQQDGPPSSLDNIDQIPERLDRELRALVALQRIEGDHPVQQLVDEFVLAAVGETFT